MKKRNKREIVIRADKLDEPEIRQTLSLNDEQYR
ncbi:hypothetical protein Ple7327_2852 [Pleurocapsa sp. PCC 7327]|nr:hypothetical protein Ple7327_2852 [Pleurocapsa sp. PCC 7327]